MDYFSAKKQNVKTKYLYLLDYCSTLVCEMYSICSKRKDTIDYLLQFTIVYPLRRFNISGF